MRLIFILLLWLVPTSAVMADGREPELMRGYYMTFMRMPVMDLADWKATIDCISEDKANTVILWMGGAFKSKKHPITWKYNEEHQNIRNDFVRELIDYAHGKGIRILLGFTPFGYDGVNQYTIEHPELKAKKLDGSPVDAFGIHCWGWSLCPSQKESQQFMREYIREMIFEFYPNADGLLIESSDYNLCRCADCRTNVYDREFAFVKQISEELWTAKPNAKILVFPHYFSGKKVNAGTDIEAEAAKMPFDKRWELIFTPHSAHIDLDMLKQGARGAFWNDSLSLRTPASVQHGAQTAKKHGLGFVPSLEPFSYVLSRPEFGATHLVGKRLSPLGFDWAPETRRPLSVLPARVQRFAFREFCQEPDLDTEEFQRRLAQHFFGNPNAAQSARDLLFLQECVNLHREWTTASPLVDPEYYKQRAAREKWPEERNADYARRVEQLRQIADRHRNSTNTTAIEMQQIASFITSRWSNHHE